VVELMGNEMTRLDVAWLLLPPYHRAIVVIVVVVKQVLDLIKDLLVL
jgi:hypothetical protein